MHKLLICSLYISFLLLNSNSVMAQITFEKSYGTIHNEFASDMITLADNSIVLVTRNGYTNPYDTSFFVIKLNSTGNILWTREFTSSMIEMSEARVVLNSEGRITISCGNTEDILIQLDTSGLVIWEKSYSLPNGYFNSPHFNRTKDSGIMLLGQDDPFNTFSKAAILKLDSNGITEWSKSYMTDSSTHLFPQAMFQFDDGGYLVGGFYYYDSVNNHYKGYLTMKIDSVGNMIRLIKSDSIPTTPSIMSSEFYRLSDNLFIAPVYDGFIGIDSTGAIIWLKNFYPFTPYGKGIINNYGHLLCPGMNSNMGGGFIEIDSMANVVEETILDMSFNYYPSVIDTLNDGSILTAGSIPSDSGDVYLTKADQDNNGLCMGNPVTATSQSVLLNYTIVPTSSSIIIPVITNISLTVGNPSITETIHCYNSATQINYEETTISIYPNPFHTASNLELENGNREIGKCEINIYNSLGSLMRKEKIPDLNSYTLLRNDLNNGLYFYELRTLNYELLGAGKFIIE